MREEGLQARGAYKEMPRASRRLALEALESSKDVHPSKGQKVPLHFFYLLFNYRNLIYINNKVRVKKYLRIII